MEVHNCKKPDVKCKSRVRSKGRCGKKVEFCVKCPVPRTPFPTPSDVITQKFTVGGGSGPLANMYTVDVPAGTQFITMRSLGAGGGGGGQLSEIFSFFCAAIFSDIPFIVQGGGGGGSGRVVNFNRPYTLGFPTQLTIEVGFASQTPTDITTGNGIDGGDTVVTFTPATPGFEDVIAKGGKGGTVGKVVDGGGTQQPGNGGNGGNGGGGAGSGSYFCELISSDVPAGVGGVGLDIEDGDAGTNDFGGDGGQNPNSGSSGIAVPTNSFGGGGGGASGPVVVSSGGIGGPVGNLMTSNAGGDFQIQDTGAGGGGAGIYCPELAEVGTTIFTNGGIGAHGVVEVFFYIFTVPS